MECRPGCGACCIAPSLNGPIPGMPEGKPAGVVCVNLDTQSWLCRIWGTADYPDACRNFKPAAEVCGESREQALTLIEHLETVTGPGTGQPVTTCGSEPDS